MPASTAAVAAMLAAAVPAMHAAAAAGMLCRPHQDVAGVQLRIQLEVAGSEQHESRLCDDFPSCFNCTHQAHSIPPAAPHIGVHKVVLQQLLQEAVQAQAHNLHEQIRTRSLVWLEALQPKGSELSPSVVLSGVSSGGRPAFQPAACAPSAPHPPYLRVLRVWCANELSHRPPRLKRLHQHRLGAQACGHDGEAGRDVWPCSLVRGSC